MGIDIDKLDNNNVPQAQIGLLTPPLSPNEPFEFPGGGKYIVGNFLDVSWHTLLGSSVIDCFRAFLFNRHLKML